MCSFILFGGLVGLIVFLSMANLIYAIGEHGMPFGGYFPFDTIKGLFVNFD
tara:strand:- start:427 stop:579 length:153 start_codon:yes stop_codon:yes gene_type:complete